MNLVVIGAGQVGLSNALGLAKHLAGAKPKKVIYVPGRMINIVV